VHDLAGQDDIDDLALAFLRRFRQGKPSGEDVVDGGVLFRLDLQDRAGAMAATVGLQDLAQFR